MDFERIGKISYYFGLFIIVFLLETFLAVLFWNHAIAYLFGLPTVSFVILIGLRTICYAIDGMITSVIEVITEE